MHLPLANVRVLDLSRLFPGPYVGRILADLGASVVKVEDPAGDMVRHMLPTQSGTPAAFAALNYGKQCIAIDLKAPQGKALFLHFADKADVLIESFRPGVMTRLGLDNGTLRQRNPCLIVCSITGYGQEGPLKGAPGHDLNYLARAGVLAMFGPPEAPPLVPGVQVADFGGGSWPAAVSILAALLERQHTGKGRHLDISMAQGAASYLTVEMAQRAAGGEEPRGRGMLTGGRPAYRTYRTKDGRYMALAALEPKFFANFCQVAGCPHLIESGFASDEEGSRVQAELQALFASKTQDEWRVLLADRDTCCEPVQTPEEALQDPGLHLAHHMVDGVPVLATPVGFAPAEHDWGSPTVGAHGKQVADDYGVPPSLLREAVEAGAYRLGGDE